MQFSQFSISHFQFSPIVWAGGENEAVAKCQKIRLQWERERRDEVSWAAAVHSPLLSHFTLFRFYVFRLFFSVKSKKECTLHCFQISHFSDLTFWKNPKRSAYQILQFLDLTFWKNPKSCDALCTALRVLHFGFYFLVKIQKAIFQILHHITFHIYASVWGIVFYLQSIY